MHAQMRISTGRNARQQTNKAIAAGSAPAHHCRHTIYQLGLPNPDSVRAHLTLHIHLEPPPWLLGSLRLFIASHGRPIHHEGGRYMYCS